MKIKNIIVIAAIIMALIGAIFYYGKYPSSWKSIHIGDSPEQVKTNCDKMTDQLHDIKGDFCYDIGLLHHWTLNIWYGPDDRVKDSDLTLTIGTKDIYKTFHFANITKMKKS